MPKRTIAERRAARLARKQPQLPDQMPGALDAGAIPPQSIPQAAITASAPPSLTRQMADGGLDIVRGNSNQEPLTPQGHQTIRNVGTALAGLGGPDEVIPSAARRTLESSQEIAQTTGAPVQPPQPGLESHALGKLEQEAKTPDVRKFLADMIRKYPGAKIGGQGALSTHQSESFNDFRIRALTAVRGLMQRLASEPNARIVVPTSSQVIRLVEAWVAAGTPDDFSIDHRPMLSEDHNTPGELDRFFPDPRGQWELKPFKAQTASQFPPGIYFLRHGETDQIAAQNATAGQKARAQLIAHVRDADYKSARNVAQAARSAGHMSDAEIEQTIDEALPGAQDAANLRPDQLLAAASAAGPAKRQELMPMMQRVFGNLPQGTPHELRSHLGRLGLRG